MSDDQKVQAEEKVKEEKKEEAKVSSKLQKIIDEVSDLSVLELSDLVKALEDKFGVQAIAAAPVAAVGATVPGAGDAGAQAEEKSSFDVIMTDSGANKINVIKALREINPSLGLKEAKDMTEKMPQEVLKEAKKEAAEEAVKKLKEAGAQVELK